MKPTNTERPTNIERTNTNIQNIDVIATKIEYIARDINDIKSKLEKNYVTRDEFAPIKQIVYGMVSVILLAVVGAIVALVLKAAW